MTCSFKTPQDIIQDYYHQKHIESVAPQKPKQFLIFPRGNRKHLSRELYLTEHWAELYLAEMARKNY